MHRLIDDHSRVVYCEVHDDEMAATATAVLERAVAWFAARGVRIERVLSDNGPAYRSRRWHALCRPALHHGEQDTALPATQGGKIERFHRTLADGWAYARCHTSEQERRDALPGRIHYYNHHRPHQACNGKPPITRLTNLPDQYGLGKSVCSMWWTVGRSRADEPASLLSNRRDCNYRCGTVAGAQCGEHADRRGCEQDRHQP